VRSSASAAGAASAALDGTVGAASGSLT
jgi:hypothetical protein